MVSSELIAEIREAFEALAQMPLDPNEYTGLVFDLAFEITTADTFVAGVASKMVDRARVTAQDKEVVSAPVLLDGRWWKCSNGRLVDLDPYPEIGRVATAIENLRAKCAEALNVPRNAD